MQQKYHLAQFNIARMRVPIDHPEMADFVAELEGINKLAEDSPGFVWRLQGDEGDSTDIRAFNDPMLLVNMSVWESVESLKEYTYRSDHVRIFKMRKKWFDKPEDPSMVLWWVPAGHTPTIQEAEKRLKQLEAEGPSPRAFTFAKPFPVDSDV